MWLSKRTECANNDARPSRQSIVLLRHASYDACRTFSADEARGVRRRRVNVARNAESLAKITSHFSEISRIHQRLATSASLKRQFYQSIAQTTERLPVSLWALRYFAAICRGLSEASLDKPLNATLT